MPAFRVVLKEVRRMLAEQTEPMFETAQHRYICDTLAYTMTTVTKVHVVPFYRAGPPERTRGNANQKPVWDNWRFLRRHANTVTGNDLPAVVDPVEEALALMEENDENGAWRILGFNLSDLPQVMQSLTLPRDYEENRPQGVYNIDSGHAEAMSEVSLIYSGARDYFEQNPQSSVCQLAKLCALILSRCLPKFAVFENKALADDLRRRNASPQQVREAIRQLPWSTPGESPMQGQSKNTVGKGYTDGTMFFSMWLVHIIAIYDPSSSVHRSLVAGNSMPKKYYSKTNSKCIKLLTLHKMGLLIPTKVTAMTGGAKFPLVARLLHQQELDKLWQTCNTTLQSGNQFAICDTLTLLIGNERAKELGQVDGFPVRNSHSAIS